MTSALAYPLTMSDPRAVLSVMMPAYNEEQTIATAIGRVFAQPEVGELIVVDDASRDNTWQIVKELASSEPRIRAFQQPRNQGKGTAIRRAITELKFPYAIIQDADLEVEPADYPNLLAPLVAGQADAVFGSRHFPITSIETLIFTVGNKALTFATNVLIRGRVADMETCFKLMPSTLWQSLPLSAWRFEFEPEVTARLLMRNCRIVNVPIRYRPRTAQQGKKMVLGDGWHAIRFLLRLRFSPSAVTAPAESKPPA
jgi:cellulose synthase/poly-beta-1,6-N-acetylglucosamine synthase-like glycosyltransferase